MARVLVVDDAQLMCRILCAMLEKAGHEVVAVAHSGQEALVLFEQKRPDIVTLDIQMADGDGFACLEDILKVDENARVIMVTAMGHGPKERESINKGAAAYISKPFQADQLFATIDEVLAGKKDAEDRSG